MPHSHSILLYFNIHVLPSDHSLGVNPKLYVWEDVWTSKASGTTIVGHIHDTEVNLLNKLYTTTHSTKYQVTNPISSLYALLKWSFLHIIVKQNLGQWQSMRV